MTGDLFIGYPIIATPDGPFSIDALLISPTRGVIIFDLVEGRTLGDYVERQNESANRLETKLRSHKPLMSGRTLKAVPSVITYAPIANIGKDHVAGYPVANDSNFSAALDSFNGYVWSEPSVYNSVISVIQSISTIRRSRRARTVTRSDSRGAKLKMPEDSIANLDLIQGRAVIETVDGVQRIRGLAGSGKTIILALKAAYLHSQHPDWKHSILGRLKNNFVAL